MKETFNNVFACSKRNGDKAKENDPNLKPAEVKLEKHQLAAGEYRLSSSSYEGPDGQGGQIARTTLQVTGDYLWDVATGENNSYTVTATGAADVSLNNTRIFAFNCRGARDVVSFEITTAKSIKNLRQIETGCPQGIQFSGTLQMSAESINKDSFEYTLVGQSNGERAIMSFTFSK